jgi:hypothetical protein
MLFTEIIAIYSNNHMKTLCGGTCTDFLTVQQMAHTATILLGRGLKWIANMKIL